jgi:hypothetical protein
MTTKAEGIAAQLAAISSSYRATLPEKFRQIDACWRTLQDHGWDEARYVQLYHLLHSMAGSAETMGLPELTHSARILLQALKAWSAIRQQPNSSRLPFNPELHTFAKIIHTALQP